jgi:inhibitor of KinA sporulation pathway (predicted exonuclease)
MATAAAMLANVETAIDALVIKGVSQVSVDGRTFVMSQLADLMRWRNQLRAEVATAPATSGSGGRIKFADISGFRD